MAKIMKTSHVGEGAFVTSDSMLDGIRMVGRHRVACGLVDAEEKKVVGAAVYGEEICCIDSRCQRLKV